MLWQARRGLIAGRGALDAAAGGGFSPSSLSGLLIWLDASNSGSVIRTGANVTAWNDLSGNGYNFTATNNPQYSATGFNTSYPGISFTAASSQYLQVSSVALNSTTLSVFVVMLFTNSSASNARVVSILGSGSSNDFGTAKDLAFCVNSSSTANYRPFRASYSPQVTAAYSTAATGGVVFDATNGTVYLNFTPNTPAASTGTFGATTATFAIGGAQTTGGTVSGSFLHGTIAEIIVTTGAITGTPLSDLHTYVSAKWGVP